MPRIQKTSPTLLNRPDLQPALGRSRATTICWVGLIALASGWIGVVLVGGPIGSGVPTWEALITGGAIAAIVALLARHAGRASPRTFAAAHLLTSLPLIGVVVTMYLSDELVHLTTRSSALGWVLAASLPLLVAIAATPPRFQSGHTTYTCSVWTRRGVDIAFGCATGVATASLIHVAAADTSTFDLRWALAGSIVGVIVVGGIALAPPRPALRTPLGTTWRTAPFAAAWIMAIVTAIPTAPRHELSTSAGAQVLAVTIAGGLLLTTLAFWHGERVATNLAAWAAFRLGMRRFAPRIATLALLLIGGFQAASYSEVTMDDLGQFWQAADKLANLDYAAGSFRVVLPGLPVLLLASFTALGRTYPAALAPMFVANVLLPWLIYRAALAAGAHRSIAFSVAVLANVLPVVQVYSLGSAEPDPVFIAMLAAAVWTFSHLLRTSSPRYSLLMLGGLAGALAVTRPEGPLYGGLLLLAGLTASRSRWAIAGCGIAGALAAPVAAFSMAQLGRPLPTGNIELSVATIADNAAVIGGVTAPKVARVVLLNDVRFPLLLAAILTLFSVGAACATRHRWAFAVLPVAALANVLVKLSISKYKEVLPADDMQEFVRHIAYPTPIVAVLVAVGVTALAKTASRRAKTLGGVIQALGLVVAVYMAAGSLYVLGTPEEFHHGNQSGSLLSAHIYVNAPELWMNPFDLPSGDWEFIDYRDRLFAWYAPFDNHSNTAGMAYQTLTGAVAAMGFAALLAAAPCRESNRAPLGGRRWRDRITRAWLKRTSGRTATPG